MFNHKISRWVKISTIAAVAVAGVLSLGSQLPGSADAAIDPFIPYDALTNPELSELRGGFHYRGFKFNIGVDVRLSSFINGVGLISFLSFDEEGDVTFSSTTFFPGPGPAGGQTVEQTGGGVKTTFITEVITDITENTEITTIVHELTPTTFKSIIETSGNNLNITNTAQVDISVPAALQAALDSFSRNILSTSIGAQIGLSSLF